MYMYIYEYVLVTTTKVNRTSLSRNPRAKLDIKALNAVVRHAKPDTLKLKPGSHPKP